jgi:hypothetical protein
LQLGVDEIARFRGFSRHDFSTFEQEKARNKNYVTFVIKSKKVELKAVIE